MDKAGALEVLVVEGEPASSFLLCLQLRHLGYHRLNISQTLSDALERIHLRGPERPELVVLDVEDDHIGTVAPLATAIRAQGIAFIAVVSRNAGALPPAYDAAVVICRPPGMSDVSDAICLAQGHDPWSD